MASRQLCGQFGYVASFDLFDSPHFLPSFNSFQEVKLLHIIPLIRNFEFEVRTWSKYHAAIALIFSHPVPGIKTRYTA